MRIENSITAELNETRVLIITKTTKPFLSDKHGYGLVWEAVEVKTSHYQVVDEYVFCCDAIRIAANAKKSE